MNCSDSAPGPVIVKYEDDVPQMSGKPCIDFQPDDRWQIKDDDDHDIDTINKKTVVNDTKKSKDHSDEERLGSAVNGDSDKIDPGGAEKVMKNVITDSCVRIKQESLTLQKDSELGVDQLTEKELSGPLSTKGMVKSEEMHNLSVSPIKTEPSENENNASTTAGEKGAEVITSGIVKAEILQDGSELVSSTENSFSCKKDAIDIAQLSQEKADIVSCSDNAKVVAETVGKTLKNCNEDAPKSIAESGPNLHVDDAANELPPKLENHSTAGELSQDDVDMPDISGCNSSSAAVTTCDNESISNGKDNKGDENGNKKAESSKDDSSNKDDENNKDDSSNKDAENRKAQKSVELDNEVQVISCGTDSDLKEPLKAQNCTSHLKTPHDVVLLNSLKGVLKAGQYKPVKFPHTGTLNLASNEVIIESPSLLVPLLIKEADTFPPANDGQSKPDETSKKQSKPPVSKNFFESSVGKFLISLGMGRVEEWYHRDMKKSKLKQIKKYGPDEKIEEEFHKHHKEYMKAKEANSVFSFRLHRCQFCDFKSESLSVMEAHYLIPHLSPRKEYKCNFCVFLTRDPKEIIFHFEALHGKKAVLDFMMPFHECPFCCFQSHLKTKVNAHINRCRKHFMPTHNQAPPFDFEFPGVTTKPVTMADILAHRAIMNAAKSRPNQSAYNPSNATSRNINVRNKLALMNKISNQNSVNSVQSSTLVKQLVGQQPKPLQPASAATSIQLPHGLVITRPRANLPQVQNSVRLTSPRITTTVRQQVNTRKWVYNSTESQLASSGISITPVTKVASQGVWTPNLNNTVRPAMKNITVTPISTSSNQVVSQKPGPPQPVALFTNVASSDSRNGNRGPVIMSVQSQATRLPLGPKMGSPRIHIPYQRLNTPPSQVVKGSSGNTFVMCEICDSYIKDLEELRTHMNWVHKVKIHPKMLVSRPPLNCQKCQWRFFTDQGLERHLLGAHGLVTTNMQEMANKNQDGGRCIICGAVFTYKLVSHMTQVHKVTLKPAHLSYKCTVCTATFTLYRLFESHVYNVHSGSAKRPAEEQSASEPPSKKANIVVVTPPEPREVQEVTLEKCKKCDLEVENLEEHLKKKHIQKCSVKVCHIEKCEKCLYSTDEILVIRMSDFGIEDDDSDDDDDDNEDEEDNDSNSDDNECKISTADIKSDEDPNSTPVESSTDKV